MLKLSCHQMSFTHEHRAISKDNAEKLPIIKPGNFLYITKRKYYASVASSDQSSRLTYGMQPFDRRCSITLTQTPKIKLSMKSLTNCIHE